MTTESIVIKVSQEGAKSTARDIEDIGKSAESAASGVGVLKTALAALTAVIGFNVFKELSSTWVQLKSQVDGFTSSMGETNAVMDRLVEISNRNKAALDITAQTYISNAAALTELGYSTKSQIDFTEAMSNALTVSGAKGQRAETVINALSKAMMAGKLKGENWNTVLQQGGRIVTALADGMGVSLAELRRMAAAGELSSNSVFTALTSQLEKLAEEADKMPSTINDAFQEFKTSLTSVIGQIDESLGITEKFVAFSQFVSENLNIIVPILLGIGTAITIAFAPTAINSFILAYKTLMLLMSFNPFVTIAAAIAGVTVALLGMRDATKTAGDESVNLIDLMGVAGDTIAETWNGVRNQISDTYGELKTAINGTVALINDGNKDAVSSTSGAVENIHAGWAGLFGNLEDGWVGVVQFVLRLVDNFIAAFLTGLQALGAAWGLWIVGLVKGMADGFNKLVQIAEDGVNKIISAVNGPLEYFGKKTLDKVSLGAIKVDTSGLQTAQSFLNNFAVTAPKRAKEIVGAYGAETRMLEAVAKARNKKKNAALGEDDNPNNPNSNSGKGKKGGGRDNAAKELEELTKAYETLKGTLDPIWKAQQEVTKGEETLNKAMSAGLVSLEDKNRLMGLLNDKYKDALDPLGKINRDMQKELDLLKLDADSRKIKIELDQRIQELQKQGVVVTGAETDALREKIALLQEEARITQIKDGIVASSSSGQLKTFTDQMEAVKRALNSGAISGPDATNAIKSFLPDADQVLAGTQMIVEAQLSKYENLYKMIDVMKQKNLLDDQQYAIAHINIAKMEQDAKLEMLGGFWGTLSNLSRSENSKMAAVGKAAAIAQATMSAFVAGNKALAEGGAFAGPAMKAAIIAQGMMSVAQIAATNLGFKTGGSFIVGGSGAPDSQQVAFRASPGEKVSITKANNVKKGDQQDGESNTSSSGGMRIVNVVGDGPIENYMTSSSGERVFLNYIGENRSAIKAMLEG